MLCDVCFLFGIYNTLILSLTVIHVSFKQQDLIYLMLPFTVYLLLDRGGSDLSVKEDFSADPQQQHQTQEDRILSILHYTRQSLAKECDAVRSQGDGGNYSGGSSNAAGGAGNASASASFGTSCASNNVARVTNSATQNIRATAPGNNSTRGSGTQREDVHPITTQAFSQDCVIVDLPQHQYSTQVRNSQHPAAQAAAAAPYNPSIHAVYGNRGSDGGISYGTGAGGQKRSLTAMEDTRHSANADAFASQSAVSSTSAAPVLGSTVLTQADVRRAFKQANGVVASFTGTAAAGARAERTQVNTLASSTSSSNAGSSGLDGRVAPVSRDSQQVMPYFTHTAFTAPSVPVHAVTVQAAAGQTQFSVNPPTSTSNDPSECDLFLTQKLEIPVHMDSTSTQYAPQRGTVLPNTARLAQTQLATQQPTRLGTQQGASKGNIWSQRPALSKAALDSLLDD